MPKRVQSVAEVVEQTGISVSTLYEWIAQGKFVSPIPLGERKIGFLASEVDAWIEARVAQRDAALAGKPGQPTKRQLFWDDVRSGRRDHPRVAGRKLKAKREAPAAQAEQSS